MASQNHVMVVDQDGVGEAEGPDAVCDLPDLFARMRSGIVRIGFQMLGLEMNDRKYGHRINLSFLVIYTSSPIGISH
ncbi:MAG: hypothetical protein ACREDM_07555 [Methylocella sp.]